MRQQWLVRGLVHHSPWARIAAVMAVCLTAALPVGAILGFLGPLYGSAALIALAAAYLMLRSTVLGLIGVLSVICLLPFAALPVNIGFVPTLLDIALLVVFFAWLSRLATRRDGTFITAPPTAAVIAFISLSCVSFVAGLSHSALTANILRHFIEVLMSVLIFVLVINVIRNIAQLRMLTITVIFLGTIAALIGIMLYFMPRNTTVRLLSLLGVLRYPRGMDVLRYIEDNPELPLRATSTSVDPNVLGGMLIFVAVISAAHLFAERPILPRRLVFAAFFVQALCMILTFSRGSLVGFLLAVVALGSLRYRRLLLLGLGVLLLLAILPPSQVYVRHFLEGVQVQDQATQMRMGEYKDALALISRYPWFGVGFAGTPDIDTYLGVSNVYLLIAEEMGILGLAAFVAAMGSFFAQFLRARRLLARGSDLEPLYWGPCLAVAGALAGGMLDHYLFNLDFPHAAALLWFVVGLGTVAMLLVQQQHAACATR